MWRRTPRPDPGGAKAFAYALAVHAVLLLLLGVSLRFSAPPPSEPPRVVQARVVDDVPNPAPAPPDSARLEEQRRQAAETEAAAERARQAEVKKRQEAERQKQQAAERKKQAAEAEKAEQQKAALEKKRVEAQRRKEAEAALQKQVEAEEALRALRESERYTILIRQKVQRSWNRPAGFKEGASCKVRVRLVPGGEVIQATVIESCGNPVFDRSVENAVFKASPLPVPDDSTLFERTFRELNLDFKPSG